MKQYYRYQIDFSGKWIDASVICMAVSFFATMVYYFGIVNLADCQVQEILFSLLLPAALSGAYVFLLKIRQLNAPGIYGIIGAALCMTILIGCMFTGNAIRIMLGLFWYLISALALLACVGGYLPGKQPVTILFGVAIVFRLIFFPVKGLDLTGWFKELSVLFAMAAVMLLPLGLKSGRTNN